MKKWNFKVKRDPQEVSKKLKAAFASVGGFVFNIDDSETDSVAFNFRKRVKYPDQILHRNRIVVIGKIFKTDTENETDIEISFKQHYLMILTVLTIVFSAVVLLVMLSRAGSSASIFLLGGLLLAAGTVLWVAMQRKFEKDIQNYKTLISGIVAS